MTTNSTLAHSIAGRPTEWKPRSWPPTAKLAGLTTVLIIGLSACGDGAERGKVPTADFSKVPFAPAPDPDLFYAQPAPMPDVPAGTILDAREVTFAPALSIPLPQHQAWQLQYMTRDVNGHALAAVTTVVQPLVPAIIGPAPLVSYQFAYNSLGAQCTPSHALIGGMDNTNIQLETLTYIAQLMLLGWVMNFPDYEGPYHAYGAGKLAGQAVLDSLRAALSFDPLELEAESPIGVWGYSGGGLATSWAASLHSSYAPELNIVGAASGGTPADVFSVVQTADGGPFFNLIFSAIVGANRAYPDLIPDEILTDAGREAINALKDGCVGGEGLPLGIGAPSASLSDYTTVEDPYSTPGAQAVKAEVTLPKPGLTPITDMYIYHEILDELVPIAGVDTLVDAWCQQGVHISYQRSLSGEHIAGVATGAPLALTYLIGRLNGSPINLVPPTARVCN